MMVSDSLKDITIFFFNMCFSRLGFFNIYCFETNKKAQFLNSAIIILLVNYFISEKNIWSSSILI